MAVTENGAKSGHTTIWVSREFHSYLSENAPKSMTYEEFLKDNLNIEG